MVSIFKMLGTITIILEFYVQVNSSSRWEQIKDIFRESSDGKFEKKYQSIYFSEKETKSERKVWNSGTKNDEAMLI